MATSETRTTTTSELGYYIFPSLSPATYRLEAEMAGFRRFIREPVRIDVALAATLDIALTLGETRDSVTVTAEAPLLQSGSASLAHLIDNKRIIELPLSGRNAYSFAALVPGVRASRGFTQVAFNMYNDQFVSINGSRVNQNQFLMDGGTNTTAGFNGPGLFPSLDMVEEYKVQTNNFSAEFANTAGGVVNVVSKSGTNQFHGSVYEFLRNDKLTANDFFLNRAGREEPPFRFNQFGATLGGPIKKNRDFFFFAYEGLRWVRGFTAAGTMPTALQRTGDFSQTRTQSGALIVLYDPLSTRPDPARPGRFVRSPFTGNVIPLNRFDPVSRRLLQFTPPANTTGDPVTGANNFVSGNSADINKDLFSIRGDHSFTDNHKVFLRYSANNTTQERPNFYGPEFALSVPVAGDDTYLQRQVTLSYTGVLTPQSVLDLNSSFLRYYLKRRSAGLGYDPVQLGFPAYLRQLQPRMIPCFPSVSVTGMGVSVNVTDVGGGFLGNCALLGNSFDTFQEAGSLTYVRGGHSLKSGANLYIARWSARNFFIATHNYSFSPAFTQGPDPLVASATAGLGYASYLLGYGGGSIRSDGPGQNLQALYWGVFFQDDWKVTPSVTLNLGVRYDRPRPWTERFNRVTAWCHDCPVPLRVPGLELRGGPVFPGVEGRSRGLFDPDNNNIAPRFGLAWSLNPVTVVRAGYGIFFGPTHGGAVNNNSTPRSGFDATTTWVSSIDGITPLHPLSDPYPDGFEVATGNKLGLLTLLGQSVAVMDPDRETPYAQQWNVSLQRNLPGNFVVDLAYAGSRGIHLFGELLFNQLPDHYLSLGDDMRALVPNPFYGLIKTGTLAATQVQKGQLLRPYPQYTGVTGGNCSYGASTYHAFQLKVERRFFKGLSVMVSYTRSKLLDDVVASTAGGGFPGEFVGGAGLQNYWNRSQERAPAQFDAPDWLSANWIWELPLGPRKRFAQRGWLAAVAGGWQINGMATFRSGAPLSLRTSSNTLRNYGGAQRPNWTGENPVVEGPASKRLDRYFNAAAFTTPAPYAYGNVARLVDWLRKQGSANVDFALARNIPVTERFRLQFRFETFNTFNHPEFGAPGTSIGSVTAGVVSTQENTPRDIQFGLKFLF